MLRLFLLILFLSTAALSMAQTFTISIIDTYGNRSVPAASIRKVLGLKEGDTISIDNFKQEPVLARLRSLPCVKAALLSPGSDRLRRR